MINHTLRVYSSLRKGNKNRQKALIMGFLSLDFINVSELCLYRIFSELVESESNIVNFS